VYVRTCPSIKACLISPADVVMVQGILDSQTRHRRQKKLGEGEMPEIREKDTTGPSGTSQGRGKHLRVLSIKKL